MGFGRRRFAIDAVLGLVGAAAGLLALPVSARADRRPGRIDLPPLSRPAGVAATGDTLKSAAVAGPVAMSSTCGPSVPATVPYAFGTTGSPDKGPHTHTFAVTLVSGTLADGETVRILGATSGPLQQFPLHVHLIDSVGVLGADCSFSTREGGHAFALHAGSFIVPAE